MIDAALGGPTGSMVSYFFHGDQFTTYDWGQDRATRGAKSIAEEWILPPGFVSPGFGRQVDAGLVGHEPGVAGYENRTYFFRDGGYTRHDSSNNAPRPFDSISPLSAWKLTNPPFDKVDAVLNGKFSRKGKTYFFRGPKYGRYDWANDQLEYVKDIPLFAPGTVPVEFHSGIDAVINGQGAFGDFAYLFKGNDYIRLNWDPTGSTPVIDVGIRPIVGNWPGLAEFLLAGEAKSKAFEWLWTAIPQTRAYRDALSAGLPYPDAPFLQLALATHFRLPDPANVGFVNAILANLEAVERALHQAPQVFKYRNEEECRADGRAIIQRNAAGAPVLDPGGNTIPILDADGKPQPDSAAYTRFNVSINFTKLYPARGEACRAAQIIHESVHYVDSNNAQPNDVPEWYVTAPIAAALGLTFQPDRPTTEIVARYDAMAHTVALHNPSSYASFVQHLRYRSDTRYGELRQSPLPGLW